MNPQDRKHIEELKEMITHLNSNVDDIKRGMYGDAKNKFSGMITNQRIMDERIHDLEESYKQVNDFKKKFVYYGSIVIAVVGYGINKLIDFIIKTMS